MVGDVHIVYKIILSRKHDVIPIVPTESIIVHLQTPFCALIIILITCPPMTAFRIAAGALMHIVMAYQIKVE